MAINIMVDLETLGNGNNAVIVSIGAAFFDSQRGVYDTFYEVIDPTTCTERGLKIDASTVIWWMRQSDEARKALTDSFTIPIETALNRFAAKVRDHVDIEKVMADDVCIWGNGATFDNIILRNAYSACKISTPWPFWGERCYRTMKNLVPSVKMGRSGVHHNALDDAVSQAKHLLEIARYLNVEFKVKE